MTYNLKLATLNVCLIVAGAAALMPARASAACDATTIAGNYGYRLNGGGSAAENSSAIIVLMRDTGMRKWAIRT